MLKAPEPYVRVDAIKAFGSLGKASLPYVPLIIAFLKPLNSRAEEVQPAAHALGQLGASSKDVANEVAKLLEAKDLDMRSGALVALGEMGTNAQPYIQTIAQGLTDPEARIRAASAQALGQIGEPASIYGAKIAGLLKDPDPEVRLAAAKALGTISASASLYEPQLVESLTDSNAEVRIAAAEAIKKIGPSNASIAERVELFASTPEGGPDEIMREAWIRQGEDRRQFIIQQFEKLIHPPEPPKNIPAEYQAQHSKILRVVVIAGLHKMGEAARVAVPDIAKHLDDPTSQTRSMALVALGTIGKYAAASQPQVLKRLEDPDTRVRRDALYALGEFGDFPARDEPVLRKMLSDPDETTRKMAIRVIDKYFKKKDWLDHIVAQGKSKDAEQRRQAVEAIRGLEDKGKAAPKIAGLISSPDPQVSACAIWALGEAGEQALAYITWFADKKNDRDENIRRAAKDALEKIGKASEARAPQLADDLIKSEGKSNAHDTLLAMGPHAASALPKLAPLLASPIFLLRVYAVEIMGSIGPAARPYGLQIAKLLNDPVMLIRQRTLATMQKIGIDVDAALLKLAEKWEKETKENPAKDPKYFPAILRLIENSESGGGPEDAWPEADPKTTLAFLDLADEDPEKINYFDYDNNSQAKVDSIRYLAHYFSGGKRLDETFIRWLGRPISLPDGELQEHEKCVELLQAFRIGWMLSQPLQNVRVDIASKIALVAQKGNLTSKDLPLLGIHYRNLGKTESPEASSVLKSIRRLEAHKQDSAPK